LLMHLWAASVAMLQLLSARFYAGRLRHTLSEYVIDHITNVNDLRDLFNWVKATFDKRRQLKFGVLLSSGMTAASIGASIALDRYEFVDAGTVTLGLMGWFQGALGWYFLLPGVTLSMRISRYRFALFSFDPGSSALISALSNMIYSCVLVAVSIATIFTAG